MRWGLGLLKSLYSAGTCLIGFPLSPLRLEMALNFDVEDVLSFCRSLQI
jgi:hypothetical protein